MDVGGRGRGTHALHGEQAGRGRVRHGGVKVVHVGDGCRRGANAGLCVRIGTRHAANFPTRTEKENGNPILAKLPDWHGRLASEFPLDRG